MKTILGSGRHDDDHAETKRERRATIKTIEKGLSDMDNGPTVPLHVTMKRLAQKYEQKRS